MFCYISEQAGGKQLFRLSISALACYPYKESLKSISFRNFPLKKMTVLRRNRHCVRLQCHLQIYATVHIRNTLAHTEDLFAKLVPCLLRNGDIWHF